MVTISRDLAENLLGDVNDLLSGLADLRMYERYKRRCEAYESEIAELKAALLADEAAAAGCGSAQAEPACELTGRAVAASVAAGVPPAANTSLQGICPNCNERIGSEEESMGECNSCGAKLP
jgi:hypothetical protein